MKIKAAEYLHQFMSKLEEAFGIGYDEYNRGKRTTNMSKNKLLVKLGIKTANWHNHPRELALVNAYREGKSLASLTEGDPV